MLALQYATQAYNGRKGVSDDQLLAFTASLVFLLLMIGFSKDIITFIKQLRGKHKHHQH